MEYYYITGTSRGIGKALAEKLLENEHVFVIGISRTKTLDHARYQHRYLDLSQIENTLGFQFSEHPEAKKIVLINNSGTLGSIKPVGKEADASIATSYNVNLVSPSILCNKFAAKYRNHKAEKVVINVSSGAGKNAIDGWNTYCASKAGMDMFSEVMEKEQNIHEDHPIKVLSVAPGIVDTQMQKAIRNTDESDFTTVKKFVDFKNTGELANPTSVAEKYLYVLENIDQFENVNYSVRDF